MFVTIGHRRVLFGVHLHYSFYFKSKSYFFCHLVNSYTKWKNEKPWITFSNSLNSFSFLMRKWIKIPRHLIVLSHMTIISGIFFYEVLDPLSSTFLNNVCFGYRFIFSLLHIQAKCYMQVIIVELPVLFILKYKSFVGVVFISRSLGLHLLDQEVVLLILGLMNNLCTRLGNLSTHSPLQYSAR